MLKINSIKLRLIVPYIEDERLQVLGEGIDT